MLFQNRLLTDFLLNISATIQAPFKPPEATNGPAKILDF
jgi:hypothetical protein